MRKQGLLIILTFFALSLLLTACAQEQTPGSSQPEVETSAGPAAADSVKAATGPELEPVALAEGTIREDGTFRIVATTTQVNDLAQILTEGVDGIEITPLMGAGVDPHLYQPTEADIAAMNTADMVIYSGL
ncbi:MAG TPA: zinc ABC transporter substrate-binding protein, partial [Anaerolineae bacterium]|nr:zinc ABC transporter substrate-binding protein [Anaerolineae bacterium]